MIHAHYSRRSRSFQTAHQVGLMSRLLDINSCFNTSCHLKLAKRCFRRPDKQKEGKNCLQRCQGLCLCQSLQPLSVEYRVTIFFLQLNCLRMCEYSLADYFIYFFVDLYGHAWVCANVSVECAICVQGCQTLCM